jgi:hypothetical protein
MRPIKQYCKHKFVSLQFWNYWLKGFIRYAFVMASFGMKRISDFMEISRCVQKFKRYSNRSQGDVISLLLLFWTRKIRLKAHEHTVNVFMVTWLIIAGFGLDEWICSHLLVQSLLITINCNKNKWLPRTRSIMVSLYSALNCDWLHSHLNGLLYSVSISTEMSVDHSYPWQRVP